MLIECDGTEILFTDVSDCTSAMAILVKWLRGWTLIVSKKIEIEYKF